MLVHLAAKSFAPARAARGRLVQYSVLSVHEWLKPRFRKSESVRRLSRARCLLPWVLMKRAVLTAVLFCSAAALSGCPIYNHDDEGCFRDKDCAPGYACDDNSGACYVPGTGSGHSCSRPDDCSQGETCASSGQCAAGDCSFNGCVRGYLCDSSSGIWTCVTPETGAGGAPDPGGTSNAGEPGTGGVPGTTAEAGTAGLPGTAGDSAG